MIRIPFAELLTFMTSDHHFYLTCKVVVECDFVGSLYFLHIYRHMFLISVTHPCACDIVQYFVVVF